MEVEGIDRMYLNVYMPKLQCDKGAVGFLKFHRGATFASSVMMDPITREFVRSIEKFSAKNGIPFVTFSKGQRKDDIAKEHLAKFAGEEGVLFIGKAQEKAKVFRTEKRKHPETGKTYPWIVSSTAMVNHYYFYCVDRNFGPFFLKFCSYFPYNGKLCINGHEYVKRQLALEGIEHQPLDNGIASCNNPTRLQQICDELTADKIEGLFAKWLSLLPNPYSKEDNAAGYHYQLSILQAEFSLTQVLNRPVDGRIFFEEVIRENLDIGRPDHVQLIFERRIGKRTPGRFRTRVITEGVTPSLHFDYKKTRIKQYHKEGRALRTETTINDPRDFGIGKRLIGSNLRALRQIGQRANRRLDVQRIACDSFLGREILDSLQSPVTINGVRASALPFADRRVQSLLQTLPLFRLQPAGFTSRDLRGNYAATLGIGPEHITQGRLTYTLRRLRFHGLVERMPKSHRYRVTDRGLRVALFYGLTYSRILQPGMSFAFSPDERHANELTRAFNTVQKAVDNHIAARKIAV